MFESITGRLRKAVRACSKDNTVFERFTDRIRKVMVAANQEAIDHQNEHILTEHLLLALVKDGGGAGAAALKLIIGDIEKLRVELEREIKAGPTPVNKGKHSPSEHSKRAMQIAIEEARAQGGKIIGTEHLLLGLLRQTETLDSRIMTSLGISVDRARSSIQQVGSEPLHDLPVQ